MTLDDLTPVNPALVIDTFPDKRSIGMFGLDAESTLALAKKVDEIRQQMGVPDKINSNAMLAYVIAIGSRVCETPAQLAFLISKTTQFTMKNKDPFDDLMDMLHGNG